MSLKFKIFRGVKPTGTAELLKDLFLDDPSTGMTKEACYRNLVQQMKEFPHLTHVMLLIGLDDGEENAAPEVMGFSITTAESLKHAFLQQAWVKDKLDPQVMDDLFIRVLSWSESLGIEEIRMETKRDSGSIHRRWGFKERSTIMGVGIVEAFENHLERKVKRSKDNGRLERIRQRDSADTNTVPEESSQPSGEDNLRQPDGRTGGGTDGGSSIRGGDGSASSGRVAGGKIADK